MKIKVAITEDHPLTIKGIKDTLTGYPSFIITGVYPTGEDLLLGLAQQLPDVLLLDIQLPGKNGDELASVIAKKYPNVHILVLSNFDSLLYVSKMVGQTALGYLLKTTDEETLIKAIETVHAGNIFLEEGMKEKLEQLSLRQSKFTSPKIVLTPKEKEVLQLIVDGASSPEIAEKLYLSLYTVNNYRNNILLKMNVKNTAELTKMALLLGLVEL